MKFLGVWSVHFSFFHKYFKKGISNIGGHSLRVSGNITDVNRIFIIDIKKKSPKNSAKKLNYFLRLYFLKVLCAVYPTESCYTWFTSFIILDHLYLPRTKSSAAWYSGMKDLINLHLKDLASYFFQLFGIIL